MKKWIYFFLIALGLFGVIRIYYNLTDDFRLANIHYPQPFPFEKTWQVPVLTAKEHQQLAKIFHQKFTYLGKGAQCYAFASEDGQYVLKFFKFKHIKPSLFVNLLPSIFPFKDYKQNCLARKKRKLLAVFNGYDLAYRENRSYSELIYLHLMPTQNLYIQATIIDKIGLKRVLNLDDIIFVVQKKGETLRAHLKHLLNENHIREVKRALTDVLQMYIAEYKKGIYDHDHGVLRNIGFIGDQPFHLDLGKFSQQEEMRELNVYKKDLEQVVWTIDQWIKVNYPQHYQNISTFLAQQYHRWTGEICDINTIDPQIFKARRKHH